MFARGGSLLPSIYADARYIVAVIVSQAEFLSGAQYTFRNTLVGERAVPGKYTAQLADQAIMAEVTTAPSVAVHRYTHLTPTATPATGSNRGNRGILALDLTNAGLAFAKHTQEIQGIEAGRNPPWQPRVCSRTLMGYSIIILSGRQPATFYFY